jgi:hypothetical protein
MKEYLITSGFLDRQRKLILTEDYLEWENGNLKGQEFTRLDKSDIVDFKHGTEGIVWYKFTVGRQFSITIKDNNNKEVKILFQSYFGLGKDAHQIYAEIIDDVWRLYHSSIVETFLQTFYDQGEIEIQGVTLKNEGIKLRDKMGLIPWDKVSTKDYYTYFAIYNTDNPDIHSRVSYNEYGTETLWSAIKSILKEKTKNTSQEKL